MSTTPAYKKAVSVPQTATADTTLSNAGSIIACAVVADGFTLSQTDHAGVTTTDSRTYPATGMVPEQTDGRSNTTVATRSYAYDTLGRPSTRSTAKDGITHNDVFHYTKRSELVNANLNGVQHGYDYDNIGNRRQAIEGSNYSQYTANHLNQYTDIYGSVNGQEFDFTPTFDDAGNQTTVRTQSGIWVVEYDAENRPISFTNAESATVVECTYILPHGLFWREIRESSLYQIYGLCSL